MGSIINCENRIPIKAAKLSDTCEILHYFTIPQEQTQRNRFRFILKFQMITTVSEYHKELCFCVHLSRSQTTYHNILKLNLVYKLFRNHCWNTHYSTCSISQVSIYFFVILIEFIHIIYKPRHTKMALFTLCICEVQSGSSVSFFIFICHTI